MLIQNDSWGVTNVNAAFDILDQTCPNDIAMNTTLLDIFLHDQSQGDFNNHPIHESLINLSRLFYGR